MSNNPEDKFAVPEFQQQHYTENFVQCVLDGGLGEKKLGAILVVGGDGRFLCAQAVNIIIKVAAANGVSKLIIGRDGILSTPAVSHLIRKKDTGKHINGGIILTASHNPGGPKNDFGIKFNCENGGPAPDNVTERIYQLTTKINKYYICPELNIDFGQIGTTTVNIQDLGPFTVQVIDSVKDYADFMEEIFDFPKIRSFLSETTGDGRKFNILVDSMHGVTGPYVSNILVDRLCAQANCCLRTVPKPDFGGISATIYLFIDLFIGTHPDPNLTYAKGLVDKMAEGKFDIGTAFDGDGDRNMILGKGAFFVTPSDSLAIIAANLDCIPYFRKTGVKGYARSMPTACALDKVAKSLGRNCYEVPTGWKYFGNLMDSGKLSLCGEESFGTGSDHIRFVSPREYFGIPKYYYIFIIFSEKDGIWAFLAWLQILAEKRQSVEDIVVGHWKEYGRNVYTRYDYENVEATGANLMMSYLEPLIPGFAGMKLKANDREFEVIGGDNYEYKDPIDGSVAKSQGLRIFFKDGSRVIFRLSGTGSAGATIRLYVESFVEASNFYQLQLPAQELLKPLVLVALNICKMEQFTGRTQPTVIT
uniref:phosphoglucomutase (alpha-D-glucose-1,6-bisphosphate-dependent) n=1 Tax=Meloidogyne hapla TaxID=6305 RepID=A0A1I8BCH5_MELHA